MKNTQQAITSTVIVIFTAAMIIFAQNIAAASPEPIVKYLNAKYDKLSPYEKFCVNTTTPGQGLRRCLKAQPKTKYLKLEQQIRQSRLKLLNEIAWQIEIARDNKDDDPWKTFCANTTHGGKANLCYAYCVEGIPCPYK